MTARDARPMQRITDRLRSCGIGCAIVALMLAGADRLCAQADTLLLEAIVRFEIDGGPAEVIPALAYNGTILLPLRRFVSLTEVPLVEYVQDSVAVVRLEPAGVSVRFEPDQHRIVLGDSVLEVQPLDVVWWDADLFVATRELDRVFGIATEMDWPALTAFAGQTAALPVIRRMRRERRHALLERQARAAFEPLTVRPSGRLADGAVLEWSLTSPMNDPVDNLTLDVGAGARLVGGSLELRHHFQNFTGNSVSEFRASWSRAWPEKKWIRQVQLGDVFSSGLRARSLQGFAITNAPFIRASEFDVEDVLGRLPAGWEVELYDRGRLRGYEEVDAEGAFRLPLQLRYGQNPFDLVLYGPGGEVVRQTRTIRVPFSRLPNGTLEYAVAAGRCRFQPCDAVLSTDLRYGLTSRVTVQAGSDYFWRGAEGNLWQPYAAVSAAVLPPLFLTGEAVLNGRLRGSAGFEPDPNLRVELAHTIFDADGGDFIGSLFERHRTEGSIFWRPQGLIGSLFFRFSGFYATGPDVKRSIQRATATAYLGRIRSSLTLRHDYVAQAGVVAVDRSGVDLDAETVFTRARAWLRGTTARATVGFDVQGGLSKLGGTVGRQLARKVRVDVGVGWFQESGYTLYVDFTSLVPGPRLGTRSRFTSGTGTQGLVLFDGSAILDRESRIVHWSDGRDLGRAGISGVVFLDENGNGVRDAGESGLEGVPVHVGGWSDLTDERGRFAAWDLFPFEAAYVEVDSLGFDDPRLALPNHTIRVHPSPNSFQSIDVPVVIGAEVSGYVLLANESLAGVPVVLRNLTTGTTVTVYTFSDGGFYRLGVLPGEYEIGVRERSLEQLGATLVPLRLTIPAGPGEKRFEDLVLNLERAPS